MDKKTKLSTYSKMMDHIHQHSKTHDNIQQHIDNAIEHIVAGQESSREEVEKIADYLRRDIVDIAKFMVQTEDEINQWLQFDLQLIEHNLWEKIKSVADTTRLALDKLAIEASNNYFSGEITGPGSLQCNACKVPIHFHATDEIPLCPACENNEFHRIKE